MKKVFIKFRTAGEFLTAITNTPHYDNNKNRYTSTKDGVISVRSHEGGTKVHSLCSAYASIKNTGLTTEEPIQVGDFVIDIQQNGTAQLCLIMDESQINSNMKLIPQFASQHPFWKEVFKEMK